jgi:transposase
VGGADRAPWRDLPEAFGNWFTVYTRFWRWAKKNVWERIFRILSDDPDFEYVLIDATLARVHRFDKQTIVAAGPSGIAGLTGHMRRDSLPLVVSQYRANQGSSPFFILDSKT